MRSSGAAAGAVRNRTYQGSAMQILHTSSFMNQEFASDAHIFSLNQISEDTASDLLYAQMVVEAKWLGDFPVFAFPTPADKLKRYAPLYEDVKLVYPDNWDVIDKVDAFLINDKMYQMCKMQDAPFVNLAYSTSEELTKLFETEMFVVAAARIK